MYFGPASRSILPTFGPRHARDCLGFTPLPPVARDVVFERAVTQEELHAFAACPCAPVFKQAFFVWVGGAKSHKDRIVRQTLDAGYIGSRCGNRSIVKISEDEAYRLP